MSIEIPIWVNGKIRWLSGINKKTSCKEVVQALLDEEGMNKAEAKDFGIIERWRKVERPLDEHSKILKIWSHWGNEKKEVRFCLRRIDNEVDSGRGSPIGSGHAVSLRRKRNRLRGNGKPPWAHRETVHPRRLAELGNFTNRDYDYLTRKQNKMGENFEFVEDAFESDNKIFSYENIYENMQDSKNLSGRKNSGHKSYHCSGTGRLHSTPFTTEESQSKRTKCCSKREHKQKMRNSENIEKLMKLILAQGATIQNQLQRLKEREEQIESLEHEKHRERIEKNGRNYLLETYLGSLKDALAPEEWQDADFEDIRNEISNAKTQHSERAKHNKTESDLNKCSKIFETTRPRQRNDLPNKSQCKNYRSKSESRLQEGKEEGHLKRTLSDNALLEINDNATREENVLQETQIVKEEFEDLLQLKNIQSQIEVWEKVFAINKKLEKEEENLVRLHIKIKKRQTENYKFTKLLEDDNNENLEEKENSEPRVVNTDSEEIHRDRVELNKSLETIRLNLEHNSKEINENLTKLIEEDEIVQQKRNCLSKLLLDLERTDHEHNMLIQMILNREKQNLEEQQKTNSNQSTADDKVDCSQQELGCRSHTENNVKPKMLNFTVPDVSKIPQDEKINDFDSPPIMKGEVNQSPNLQSSVQEKFNSTKPKIVKIAFEDKTENYENPQSDDKLSFKEPVPVPMGALKSILKNRQNGCPQPPNLNKEFQKSQELKLNKELRSIQKNLNFDESYYQNDPTVANYSWRMPYLNDKSFHKYGQIFHHQPSLTKVPEELKTPYSIKPFNPARNPQASINSFPHITMITTKALVHNDTDSSTSSDTSGLSSMYSSSPTVEEPYVEHTYVLDTLV